VQYLACSAVGEELEEEVLDYSFVSSIVVALVYLTLAVRLYRLSVKTGQLPGVAYRVITTGQSVQYAQTGEWSTSVDQIRGALEYGAIVAFSIIFFPPKFYKRWIGGESTLSERALG
jgi:hypothetical protein